MQIITKWKLCLWLLRLGICFKYKDIHILFVHILSQHLYTGKQLCINLNLLEICVKEFEIFWNQVEILITYIIMFFFFWFFFLVKLFSADVS